MLRVCYIAEWYGEDAVTDDGFEPDCVSQSEHEDIEVAKEAAINGAEASWAAGWARVTQVELRQGLREYGPRYVNEHADGAWCGWEEREE